MTKRHLNHRRRPRTFGYWMVVYCLVCGGQSIFAEDAPPAPPAGADQAQEGTADNPSTVEQPERVLTDAERRRAGDKGGVFRPSESISEDFAMTFPVDI